jgi:uncharacterized membrane protein HdeD (DUF308 family)
MVGKLVRDLTRSWWVFALQGVLAIAIGVAAFAVPGPTLTAFIALFATYAIVSGILGIGAGLSIPNGPSWALVAGGVAGIALGVLVAAQPAATAVAVVLLVGVYAIATGVAQVVAARALGRMTNSFLLALSGVLSVVFGVLLIMAPNDGVVAVLWLIGFYAIFAGISLLGFGFRVRSAGEKIDEIKAQTTDSASTGTKSTGSTATGTTSAH